MKIAVLSVQSKKENWLESVQELYSKKLRFFNKFDIEILKDRSAPREQRDLKVRWADEALLKRILPKDFVVLFDEAGVVPKDSLSFAKNLENLLQAGHSRLVFIVGGAFGVGPVLRSRCQKVISLSTLTLSHHVALTVILEQLYRAFTIIKKIPYHNEGTVGGGRIKSSLRAN
jgi:23S rRNA (pseudouridine1915-N3)-methyltransferase